MSKYKATRDLRSWLATKAIVAVGYADNVKAVNLSFLLATWIRFDQDGEALSCYYPYAADHFQVAVVERGDPRIGSSSLLDTVLKDFEDFPHFKLWIEGDIVD